VLDQLPLLGSLANGGAAPALANLLRTGIGTATGLTGAVPGVSPLLASTGIDVQQLALLALALANIGQVLRLLSLPHV
jgi:hypothetical protein